MEENLEAKTGTPGAENAGKNVSSPEVDGAPAQDAPVSLRIIIGEKIGMTQMFDKASGYMHGVSVVKAGPCRIVDVLTLQKNGYSGVCMGFGEIDKKKLSRSKCGQFDKIKLAPLKHLKEFRVPDAKCFEIGQVVTLKNRFNAGDYVDIQGVSKGKGFAGGMKRHNFSGGPASHGASDKERAPGSIAARRSLGRVLPGQRMAGRMGQDLVTVQKVEVAKIFPEENLLLLKGSVPGADGTIVYIAETTRCRKRRVVIAPKASKKGKKEAPVSAGQKKPAAKK